MTTDSQVLAARRRARIRRTRTSRNQQHSQPLRSPRLNTQAVSTTAPKKPRNRKCDNSVGYTIAAIKNREKCLALNDIEGDVGEILEIQKCANHLRKAIQKLKSSNGSLRETRILINPNDKDLIEGIKNKKRKSKVEKMFESVLDSYD